MWKVALIFLIFLGAAQGILPSTSEIYDQVVKAVISKDDKLSNELLEKYYFTDDPDDSIWKRALNEVRDLLQKNFPIEDHITMNKDISEIKERWKDCHNKSSYSKYCEEIFTMLKDKVKDFQWPSENFMYFRKNYISIRVAYQSMNILMFSSMTNAPWINTFKGVLNFLEEIENHYNEISKYLADFEEKLLEERPFEIGEAEVCSVNKYLWKEFEQPACEKRWNKNKIPDGKMKRSSEDADNGNDDDDDDEASDGGSEGAGNDEDKQFLDTFAKPDFTAVYQLGGKSSEYDFTLKSRYTDYGGKKKMVTAVKDVNVREVPKGEVFEELLNLTIDKRDEYVKEKLNELESYLKATFRKVAKASKLFTDKLHGEVVEWRKKINNSQHS